MYRESIYISRYKYNTNINRTLSIIFMGAPGVGKGTYSKIIAPHYNATILSSGDLIRNAIEAGDDKEKSKELMNTVKSGKMVDDSIVIPMVLDYLRTIPNSFILDGFPRNLNQSKLFHQYYGVDIVIHFKLPHDILLKKLTGRRVCIDMPKCPGNFNIADINEGILFIYLY